MHLARMSTWLAGPELAAGFRWARRRWLGADDDAAAFAPLSRRAKAEAGVISIRTQYAELAASPRRLFPSHRRGGCILALGRVPGVGLRDGATPSRLGYGSGSGHPSR